jgi:peptidoglycan hydrolase-like protein with peptidoglycan-binding domain
LSITARVVAIAAAISGIGLAGGAAAVLVTHHPHHPAATGNALVRAADSAASGAQTASQPPAPPPPKKATRLTKVPPTALDDGTARIAIRLSWRPSPGTPRPTFSPTVTGTWNDLYDYETFTPASTFEPCTKYTMTIPAATTAIDHKPLGQDRTVSFTVPCPSTTALQQALMRLGYLPYHLHSSFGVKFPPGKVARDLAAKHAFHPPRGTYVADHPDVPPIEPGVLDPTTEGALEIFQNDHGIATGAAGPQTWAALLGAEQLGRRAPLPYTWVTVSESIPETLEVHRGAKILISTPANTGVAGAETPQGVFPIFARFTSTTMTGTNPDGSTYDDPGVPWVNYFNGGDAVHGFPRASYGSPQSNGCVELPISTSETVFNLLQIGDIVYVT